MLSRTRIFGVCIAAALIGCGSAPSDPADAEASSAAVASTHAFLTSHGKLAAGVTWTVDPESGYDVLRGLVSFTPVPGRTPHCASVRMVQIARVEKAHNVEYQWPPGEAPRNEMRTHADAVRGILPGYYVDHDATKCRKGAPCSPYFRDSWPNSNESHDGVFTASRTRSASLIDYPFGWSEFERISLEACARCVDDGAYLGCIAWGGEWPATADRNTLPVRASDAPSPTFRDAMQRFDAYYER